MSDMASKGFMGMHKQVYTAHKARVDSMICDALAATDSPSEKLAIIQAHKDALAAFEVPTKAQVVPDSAQGEPFITEMLANDDDDEPALEPIQTASGIEIISRAPRKRKKVPSE